MMCDNKWKNDSEGNLGHATAAFTLDVYGHVTEEMKRNRADRMESYMQALSEL